MRQHQRVSLPIMMTLLIVMLGCIEVQASDSIHTTHRVSPDQVREIVIAELRSRAIGGEPLPSVDDIELPLAVPMRPGSALRASSVCWDQDAQHVRFQLQCDRTGECLPFLAYVRTASRGNVPACGPQPSRAARSNSDSESVVRAGERAMAVLSRGGIRISAAVTCLQGGDQGEIIRVRGGEGRIFRARVLGPSLVEASLD